ncbi:MAG: NgoMIV family type II restriction endonuclease, partial [Flavobacteriales bacterium]
MGKQEPLIAKARSEFHAALLSSVLKMDSAGIPANADKSNKASVELARGILQRIGEHSNADRLAGQSSGNQFEEICTAFLKETFHALGHMRPGKWTVAKGVGGGRMGLARFEQYSHLEALANLAAQSPELAAALGSDYLIKPDVVIYRAPESDDAINAQGGVVGDDLAKYTGLRAKNNELPI